MVSPQGAASGGDGGSERGVGAVGNIDNRSDEGVNSAGRGDSNKHEDVNEENTNEDVEICGGEWTVPAVDLTEVNQFEYTDFESAATQRARQRTPQERYREAVRATGLISSELADISDDDEFDRMVDYVLMQWRHAGPSAENLANKVWLRDRTNPKQVFNSLHLANAGVKLEDNPTVLQWLKYVKMYRAKKWGHGWHDGEVYVFLLKTTDSEAEEAKLSQSLTENPKLATLGKNLQETQFGSWILKNKDPRSIPSMLGLRNADDPIVDNYAAYFIADMNKRAAKEGKRVSSDELGALLPTH
ncbi:Avirulence (Avh) protein [Phytophthora cinnamomi]|uniref:Avirulence (Avh) protein n=1 Tax=Phytophthora cinnamomi TaxID=4785 RepID=UPI00355A1AE0|nr:Avirulence (Avh) protein [Phytophthora cinnamomi]